MYKKVLSILFIICLSFVLSGCGEVIKIESNISEDGTKDLPYVIKNQDGITLISDNYNLNYGNTIWFKIETSRLSLIDSKYNEINYIQVSNNGVQLPLNTYLLKVYKRDKNSLISGSLVNGSTSIYEYIPGLTDEIYYVQVTMTSGSSNIGISIFSEKPQINSTIDEQASIKNTLIQ